MRHDSKYTGFKRHVRACNNAKLPGKRVRFLVRQHAVGWVSTDTALLLAEMRDIKRAGDRIALTDPSALPGIARELAERGLFHWRGEAFDVRVTPDSAALTSIDRGAIPIFGIQAVGVHVNGLVQRRDGLYLWIARRAMDKLMDPGKLDHVVAGGVPVGLGPAETLVKEAAEEASIPPSLASMAVEVGGIGYAMERPEGLRRDWLHCYDLMLPEEFVPRPADGEVSGFELWPLERAAQVVRDTEDFKFNVNLVLVDLFIRRGLIRGPEAESLRACL